MVFLCFRGGKAAMELVDMSVVKVGDVFYLDLILAWDNSII